MKSRTFNIVQYEKKPVTGEDLHFNEDMRINKGGESRPVFYARQGI